MLCDVTDQTHYIGNHSSTAWLQPIFSALEGNKESGRKKKDHRTENYKVEKSSVHTESIRTVTQKESTEWTKMQFMNEATGNSNAPVCCLPTAMKTSRRKERRSQRKKDTTNIPNLVGCQTSDLWPLSSLILIVLTKFAIEVEPVELGQIDIWPLIHEVIQFFRLLQKWRTSRMRSETSSSWLRKIQLPQFTSLYLIMPFTEGFPSCHGPLLILFRPTCVFHWHSSSSSFSLVTLLCCSTLY